MQAVKQLWQARKLYGSGNLRGEGGILPPTDPRLLHLTDEQIELDMLLYLDDHPHLKKKAEAYQDTEYEESMRAELGDPPASAPDTLPDDFVEVPFDE